MDTARENADVTRFVVWFLPPGNMVVFHTHTQRGQRARCVCVLYTICTYYIVDHDDVSIYYIILLCLLYSVQQKKHIS